VDPCLSGPGRHKIDLTSHGHTVTPRQQSKHASASADATKQEQATLQVVMAGDAS
jgi:hypothetical protein